MSEDSMGSEMSEEDCSEGGSMDSFGSDMSGDSMGSDMSEEDCSEEGSMDSFGSDMSGDSMGSDMSEKIAPKKDLWILWDLKCPRKIALKRDLKCLKRDLWNLSDLKCLVLHKILRLYCGEFGNSSTLECIL